jgi:hypothetical protein
MPKGGRAEGTSWLRAHRSNRGLARICLPLEEPVRGTDLDEDNAVGASVCSGCRDHLDFSE